MSVFALEINFIAGYFIWMYYWLVSHYIIILVETVDARYSYLKYARTLRT